MTSLINFSTKTFFIGIASLGCVAGCASANIPIHPAFQQKDAFIIAAFPIGNYSGSTAPVKNIRRSFLRQLQESGFVVLDDATLERFMAAHRIRYTAGIDDETARAFQKETGVNAVLITSLELYKESIYPKLALTSRLVSTEEHPRILWMDSVGLAGDDSPGMLGLGLIDSPQLLIEKTVHLLSCSLAGYLSGGSVQQGSVDREKRKRRYLPKFYYRSPLLGEDGRYTVAVLPFFNKSDRKNGGTILMLHFIRQLAQSPGFQVVEPGIVRKYLLTFRVIMDEGISFPDAELIFKYLSVDLILTGNVMKYQDYEGPSGTAKVDFSVQAVERKSGNVVWASNSRNRGDESVLFFDWGKVNTANQMASRMAGLVVEKMQGTSR